MKTLAEIAAQRETLKTTIGFAGTSYLSVYESYFGPRRMEPLKLLEIGVLEGNSLRTWRDYFPLGEITGLDIDPACTLCEPRIQTYTGSQGDWEVLGRIVADRGPFDLIIDDGSHVNTLTLAAFRYLFGPGLKPRGLYCIEDLACSYRDLSEEISTWPGMGRNADIDYDNAATRGRLDRLFLNLVKLLDQGVGSVEFVHFWHQMAIIKRKSL